MKLTPLFLLLLVALAAATPTLDSTVRFRIYRKTLHEVLEKNGKFISEFTTTDLGTVDIGDFTVNDAKLTVLPQSGTFEDFEADLKFLAGKGIHLSLNEFKFELLGTQEGKPVTLTGNLDKISLNLLVKNSEKDSSTKSSSIFDANSIPQFELEDFEAEFEEGSIKWKIDGTASDDQELIKNTRVWLDAAIKGQMIAAKIIVNSAQRYISDYLTSNLNEDTFQGSVSIDALTFTEEYAELGFVSSFDIHEGETKNIRDVDSFASEAQDDSNAIEIVFDENLINAALHSAFHSDASFSLRKTLRLEDPENEYAQMFDAILVTNVISQAWKELETEFGADKKVDAKCSFGKGLFEDKIKDVKPSQLRFLRGSKVDFTLGFGCSIVVEDSPGNWQNFRSFYAELYTKISLEISANDAIKKMKLTGDIDELRAVRIKIFKKDQSMFAEETALTMMANMGLGMAKSQASTLLDIPQIGYPTIKKCTGLTLLRPAIGIYDGFMVIS
jgi:hypothetical protein